MFILMTRVFEFSPRTTLFGGAFLFTFYYVSFSVLVQPLLKGALASAEDVGGIRGTEDDDTTRMLTRTRPRSESKSRHYQRMNSVTSDDGDLGRTHRNNNSNGRNDTDANANAKADSSSLSPIPSEEPVPGNDRTLASSTPDDAFQTTSEHNHNDSLLQPLSPSSSTVDIISDDDEEDGARAGSSTSFADKAVEEMSLSEQFELIGTLKHFMIPLFWVYFGEYVINTGINPTLGFTSMTHTAFFEYASFTYQVGVFISRSSRSYIAIRQVYWFPILQMANVLLFLAQSIFGLVDLPYLWLTLVMWEGLLGGGTYVNVFHQVKTDTPKEYAEWGMGVVSLSDSFGIVLAAILSIYLECWLGEHNGVDTGGC